MNVRQFDISQRGHGFTTLQMKRAAQGALYIWPVSRSIDYAKRLAKELGRDDLEIVSGAIFDRHAERLRGRRFTSIVLDHACEPTAEEVALLREVRAWCLPRDAIAERAF